MYCAACGHNGTLESEHKLVDYILKNAPQEKVKDDDHKDIIDAIETDVQWYSETSKEAVERRRKEMLEN